MYRQVKLRYILTFYICMFAQILSHPVKTCFTETNFCNAIDRYTFIMSCVDRIWLCPSNHQLLSLSLSSFLHTTQHNSPHLYTISLCYMYVHEISSLKKTLFPSATCLAMRLLTLWQRRAQQKSKWIGPPDTVR